jgi:site-specific DNA-methyltransferase (cytosine-N4-specific)
MSQLSEAGSLALTKPDFDDGAFSRVITTKDIDYPFPGYKTYRGTYYNTKIEQFLESSHGNRLKGKVNLLITSPPFPLNKKKSYGNLNGDEYLSWLQELAPQLASLLTEDGSIVIEIGNAWNPDEPTMSLLPMEALIAFKKAANLHLCQEFICHNPARLPSPVQYVNVERCRMKDSWTRIWWLSKTTRPKADNRRALLPYSQAMLRLLKSQKYNAGKRPSEHSVGATSFLRDNGGAIPASCLTKETLEAYLGSLLSISNTISAGDPYLEFCRANGIHTHPARMQQTLVAFFVSFLTDEDDLIFDPFGGSNTSGSVAQTLKRRWLVTEASDKYMESSKARFVDRRLGPRG